VKSALLLAAAAGAGLLAACSDGRLTPLEPHLPAPPPPAGTLAALECTADVHAGTVECTGAPAAGISANLILGGQNVNLRLASANAAYDSAAQVFRMDVTVQNLLVQQMGTADGADTAGVVVFFASGPSATSGAGAVAVRNADGDGAFTAFAQPYFHYPQVLKLHEVSAARSWEFDAPRTVQSFTFRVYVRTPLLPVVVFDRLVNGNRDVYRVALDGSDLVRLTTHAADDQSPTVGGGTLVWVSHRDGNAELYSRPLTGGADTRLTTTSARETEPALTRDGQRLAYVYDGVGGVGKVYVAAGNATGSTRATASTFGFGGSPEAAPVWDLAGQRLALVATAGGTADVYHAPLAAGAALPLVPTLLAGGSSSAEVNPAYAPDGTRLAFATNLTGDGDLYLVDLATGVRTRLTSRAGAEANPSWLDDGRLVYLEYHAGNQGVLRWVDPADPARSGTIPLPAGGRPDRPRAVHGP
jgi:hypothetical protein